MLKKIKTIIFDVDGTLIDSMWIWKNIDIEYLKKFNIPLPTGLQKEIEGMCFDETAAYFKNRFHIEDSIEQIKSDWNEMALHKYKYETPLKDGVLEFLEFCVSKNMKLGIATSNSKILADEVIKAHNLKQYFSVIKTGCDVKKGKPAPDIYLAAAGEIGSNPKDCLVFEDIIPGIMAGKSAGMKVCAMEDSYSMDQKEEKIRLSDYYFENYHDVLTNAKRGI